MNRGKPLAAMSAKKRAERAEQGDVNPTSTFASKQRTREPKLTAKPATRRTSAGTGPDSATVDLVLERDGYSCVLCGEGVGDRRGTDYSIHHRKRRSQGLDNSPSNLIVLCGNGTQGCHGAVHAKPKWARNFGGWILKGSDDPAAYPVLVDRADRWVLLTPKGRRVTTSAPSEAPDA